MCHCVLIVSGQAGAAAHRVYIRDGCVLVRFIGIVKIRTKLFALMAVPLGFLLLLTTSLVLLNYQTDAALQREAKSRELHAHITSVYKLCIETAQTLGTYIMTREEALAYASQERIDRAQGYLRQITESEVEDAAERKQISKFKEFVTESLRKLHYLLVAWQERDHSSPYYDPRYLREELQKIAAEGPELTDSITKRERLRSAAYRQQVDRLRFFTQWILVGGGFLCFSVCIGATYVFSRDVVNRILHIVGNIEKMSAGAELDPVVPSNDEIHFLDSSFCQMASRIRTANQRERAILNSASDVIAEASADLKFLRVNSASIAVWGYTPRELESHSLQEFMPDSSLSLSEIFGRVKEGEATFHDFSFKTKTGVEVWTRWSISRAKEEGTFICVARDVSAQRKLEQLKAEFNSMISHDLRAPVGSAQLFLETLERNDCPVDYAQLSDKARIGARAVLSSMQRAMRLVDSMLEMDRLEASSLPVETTEVRLAELTEDVLSGLASLFESKSLQVSLLDDTDARVDCNYDAIARVVQNFLSNAAKHSEHGALVKIVIQEKGDRVELRVIDQGPGIAVEKQQQAKYPLRRPCWGV